MHPKIQHFQHHFRLIFKSAFVMKYSLSLQYKGKPEKSVGTCSRTQKSVGTLFPRVPAPPQPWVWYFPFWNIRPIKLSIRVCITPMYDHSCF